jgi:hypothetical protein
MPPGAVQTIRIPKDLRCGAPTSNPKPYSLSVTPGPTGYLKGEDQDREALAKEIAHLGFERAERERELNAVWDRSRRPQT